jgi:exodeoxyribonuclease VII large subunit
VNVVELGAGLAAPQPEGAGALTVSQLNRLAREILEEGFPDVWVRGEVSRFLAHASGHWYFTLKDEGAAIKAAMFRGANRAMRFQPTEGMQVLARGRVSIYEQQGSYQIVVEHLEPAGEGALFAAYERLKRKLAAEGLFDRERKRPIPRLPRRIGIATSTSGAALRDILKVLQARGARVSVVIAPCRVQGDGSAEDVARALRLLDSLGDLDVVICGRGGGSLEDLWAFNEEFVARTIYEMSVPVISAVGHEIDTTIADLVADVRAATPSQAAEMVCESADVLRRQTTTALSRLRQALRSQLADTRGRLALVGPERLASRLAAHVERLSQHVDNLLQRLVRATLHEVRRRRLVVDGLVGRVSPEHLRAVARGRRERRRALVAQLGAAARLRVAAKRERLRVLVGTLEAISPEAVLERGYAILQRADGRVVRAWSDAEVGDSLRARLSKGALTVDVRERFEQKG